MLIHLKKEDIEKEMKRQQIEKIEDVFLCLYQKNGFYFLKKSILTPKMRR